MADTSTSGERASTSTINGRFQAEILAILLEAIGGKLRKELEPLKEARNEALRTIDRDHPDPYSFFLQHSFSYMSECDKFLLDVKPILHGAVDAMVEEIQSNLFLENAARRSPSPHVPHHPVDVSYHESLERTLLFVRERLARSANRSTEQEPRGNAGESCGLDTALSVTEAGNPIIIAAKSNSAAQKKRPASLQDEELGSPRPLKKKTTTKKAGVRDRKTIKKAISSAKEDECVFRYEGHEGFYVLRCNVATCKKRAGIGSSEPIYFREHPFGDSAAWKHFTLRGHQVKDQNEAFIKYAAKVTDATEECNLQRPEPAPASDSNHVSSPTPLLNHTTAVCQTPAPRPQLQKRPQPQSQYPLSPLSPLCINTQDKGKGKQPERVFTVDDEVAEAATEACGYWDRKLAFQNLHRSPFGKGKGKGVAVAGGSDSRDSSGGDEDRGPQQFQGQEGMGGEEADYEAPDILMTGAGGCELLSPADIARKEEGDAGSIGSDSTATNDETAVRFRGTSETLRSRSVSRRTTLTATVPTTSDSRRRSSSDSNVNNDKDSRKGRSYGDGEDESESESEEEIPSLETLFSKDGRRQTAHIDYKEKPPRIDEFE